MPADNNVRYRFNLRRRQRRCRDDKASQAVAGAMFGGFLAGAVLAGPAGAVLLGLAAAGTTANILKKARRNMCAVQDSQQPPRTPNPTYHDADAGVSAMMATAMAETGRQMAGLEAAPNDSLSVHPVAPGDGVLPLAQARPVFPISGDVCSTRYVPVGSWVCQPFLTQYREVYLAYSSDDGRVTAQKAREPLMGFDLPVEVLGRVWDLADIDRDGCLDEEEFALALYLCANYRHTQELPRTLTEELMPPSKQRPLPGNPFAEAAVVGSHAPKSAS